jgi:hypothetical protein
MSTSKVDSEKRVVLPDGKPGEVYEIQQQDAGRYLLVRLERPEPGRRLSRTDCLKAIEAAPLTQTLSWEQLRELTREP